MSITDTFCDEFAPAGEYVAFHVGASGDETYDAFSSFNARTGRLRYSTGHLARTDRANTVTALGVTSTGALAFLQQGVLQARDAAGTRKLADEAAGQISGLRGKGRSVIWSQGGHVHSAQLQ